MALQARPKDRTLHRQEAAHATKSGQQVVSETSDLNPPAGPSPDAGIGMPAARAPPGRSHRL